MTGCIPQIATSQTWQCIHRTPVVSLWVFENLLYSFRIDQYWKAYKMVHLPTIGAFALATTLTSALPTTHDMIERSISNADATNSSVSINRQFQVARDVSCRETTDFFPEDMFYSLCSHGTTSGNTSATSPFVEDCAFLKSFVYSQIRGFWNLNGLIENMDYKLLNHNTCSLYYRVQTGHDSLQ